MTVLTDASIAVVLLAAYALTLALGCGVGLAPRWVEALLRREP